MKHPPTHGSQSFRLGLLCFALAGAACNRHDDLKVRIFNDARAPASLQNVLVFGGGEKAWWSEVAGGTSVGTLLRPGGEPHLSMTFARGNRTFHWEGPTLTPGKGYTVHVHIDPNGAVAEQHCLMPCLLP